MGGKPSTGTPADQRLRRNRRSASVRAKHMFKTLPRGTKVTWHYRSAIGHGTIDSVAKMGTSHATTLYNIREHDHHISSTGSREKPVVQHYGSALTRA